MLLRLAFAQVVFFLFACSVIFANTEPALPDGISAGDWGQKTDFNAEVKNNVLRLSASDVATTIAYDRPKVWDATGRMLPAKMALNGQYLGLQVDDRDAVYPVKIDPTFAQQVYLKASNTDPGDVFGFSVYVSGNTAVVGAPGEDSASSSVNGNQSDNTSTQAGAAYIFVQNGVGWSQQAYLKAANSDARDRFGYSVVVSGDTVVVGAPGEAAGDGAAYVFVRNGTNWSQQAYLRASNSNIIESSNFGFSVALSDDTIVVGAPGEARSAGAAYVFVRDGTSWSEQAYLKASNAEAFDEFGYSVSVSGDTVVVGARFEDSAADGVNGDQGNYSENFFAGAAYIFVRNGTSWDQQAYLKASNSDGRDFFGTSVAVSGDTVVVGAIGERSSAVGVNSDQSNNDFTAAGAAYVFVRNDRIWSQQAYLKALNNSQPFGRFGFSVAVSGDTVVVGAMGEAIANVGNVAGAVHMFVRNETIWSQEARLKASNGDAGDQFGFSVAVSNDTVVASSLDEDSAAVGINGDQSDNTAEGSGAVYVFGDDLLFFDGFELD